MVHMVLLLRLRLLQIIRLRSQRLQMLNSKALQKTMIVGKHYYFFRLDGFDGKQEYRIAESVEDLNLRFGDLYMRRFAKVYNVGEFTRQHILAINLFLDQQISLYDKV